MDEAPGRAGVRANPRFYTDRQYKDKVRENLHAHFDRAPTRHTPPLTMGGHDWRRLVPACFGWALALHLGAGCAEDLPSPPLLSDLMSSPQASSLVLSPDGKQIAGVVSSGAVSGLFVMDTTDLKPRRVPMPAAPTSATDGRRPYAVNWVANDILAVDFDSEQSESIDLKGNRLARLGERFIRRMSLDGPLADSVLVYRDTEDGDIDQVDPRTGARRSYRFSLPGIPVQWAFDAAGRLLAVTMRDTSLWSEETRVSNWYRSDEAAPWQKLQDVSITEDYWVPVRVLPEPNNLAVVGRFDRDTAALFRYDTVARRPVSLMAGHPNEDVVRVGGLAGGGVDSVVTHGLKPERHWFDARWAKVQASVDSELPDRVNLLSGNPDANVLVTSYGDVDPGRWFLLETKTMAMREVTAHNERIDPKRMRPMQTMHYAARDGLDIPAYLTRPARSAGEPAPMVVLVHGGPTVRDTWSWNEEVQVLATQGYVVFQPQFRGSSGFGHRFEEAGYQQWGRAMQDDITDGVMELIKRKVADPSRICIVGASYGGYAALWGAIKTPTLYRCAVSFAGVSDLESMISGSIFDDSDRRSRAIQRARVGDPAKQREQLAEVSPLRNADKVQIPLLMLHGERDRRVLISQSEKMVAALKAKGKSVEWVPFEYEGHGLYWSDDKKRYYAAVLSFLQRHIGDTNLPPPAPPAATTAATAPAADSSQSSAGSPLPVH